MHVRAGRAVVALVLSIGVAMTGNSAASAAIAPAQHVVFHVSGFRSYVIGSGGPVMAKAVPLVIGTHAFTPQSPSWNFSDAYGAGSEQITYGTTKTEAWGYQFSAASQAAMGSSIHENAYLYCGSTLVASYGTHDEAANYTFHGSKGGLNTSCNYHTSIQASGPKGGAGGDWYWYITLV